MTPLLLENEPVVRACAFLGVFAALAALEAMFPRRRRRHSRRLRWPGNLGIVVLNTAILRLTFPIVAVGMAALLAERGWGLFNVIETPAWLAFALSFLLLDLAIYAQHLLFHHVPLLWRLHRMHHSDLDLDVTTGVRFHPLEILLSMAIKLAVVALVGSPVAAVLVFEVALNATSMFNHANLKLPIDLDRVLRLITVTPDMHRVHHSVRPNETNSNYGFNLPWWDRLFATYRAQPEDGHARMTIGLEVFRDERSLRLDQMLLQPLKHGPATPSL